MYTCPCDGYAYLETDSSPSSIIYLEIRGGNSNSPVMHFRLAGITGGYLCTCTFIRKGMRLKPTTVYNGASAYFFPMS